jgi:hypothetical protein
VPKVRKYTLRPGLSDNFLIFVTQTSRLIPEVLETEFPSGETMSGTEDTRIFSYATLPFKLCFADAQIFYLQDPLPAIDVRNNDEFWGLKNTEG